MAGIMSEPFLGEVRVVHFAAAPREIGFTYMPIADAHREVAAIAVARLEQWNGKEWITVHEFWP